MVMEEGICIDSTAAKQQHLAETAIHLDTNKITDLFPEKQVKDFTQNVNIPLNVLSRFDYIVDIPADVEKQVEISLERFGGNTIIGEKPEKRLQKWAENMRKLTAYMRDKHSEIEIPKDVRAYAREKFEELQEENIEHLKDLQLLANFMQRMHNSIHKFIAANARISDRSIAEKEDVDNSMKFLTRKLDVLKEIQKQIKIPKGWEIPRGKGIAEWIVNTYKTGEEVTVKILQDKYESEFGIPLNDRTCQRWIKTVVRKGEGKGKRIIM
jgi:DNA replicative helicase MCM subunit Mcm2 (Cdc46/Mcm family)